jgi:predicted acetyltransferase
MKFQLRPVRDDEVEVFGVTVGMAMGLDTYEDFPVIMRNLLPLERTIGAFDNDRLVGTLATFPFQLSVPGGVVPMAGTSVIGVLPTHRRRGLLRAMMQNHLQDSQQRGDVVSGLWASETTIYGRFDYATAAHLVDARVDRHFADLDDVVSSAGSVRLVSRDEALQLFPEIYRLASIQVPGMPSRSPGWWQHKRLNDAKWRREGASSFRYAVIQVGEKYTGYALYRQTGVWRDGGYQGRLIVVELVAIDTPSRLELWRFLHGVDLVTTIELWNQPVDDPVAWRLRDQRRLARTVRDSLWIRILDIPRALAARRYPIPGRLVLEVTGGMLQEDHGRFELEATGSGAECRPTTAAPDITLPLSLLSSIYLGGNRLTTLARAGGVCGSADAINRADALFASATAPWCPEVF